MHKLFRLSEGCAIKIIDIMFLEVEIGKSFLFVVDVDFFL